MRALGRAVEFAILLTSLAASAYAEARTTSDLVSQITLESIPAKRVALCAEMARAPHHGLNAFAALSSVMDRDSSKDVRLAAAKALATWPDQDASARLERFFKTEAGAPARRALLSAMAAEPSRSTDAATTGLMMDLLASDPDPGVRRDAAAALGARGDPRALNALRRIASADEDKSARDAAGKAAAIILAKIAPADKAVKDVDPCPPPWGWCECGAPIIKTTPRCLTRDDCRALRADHYLREGMTCSWDGESLGFPR